MLSRARQYRKEGINHQNANNYAQAIIAYKQARGEATSALEKPRGFNTNHLCYALKAEVSINLAECYMQQAMDEFTQGTKTLADMMPVFKEVAETLNEAKENLKLQTEAMVNAIKADHNGIKASNEELQANLLRVKKFITKNKIVLYFNTAIGIIHDVDQKQAELWSKAKDIKAQADNKKLSKELKEKLDEAIKLLRSALSSARSITDDAEIKEINDLMIELYEEKADFFAMLEGDAAFYEVKCDYLGFMLRLYSDAFHVARQAKAPKEEQLPLFLSVLNVLEEQAKLATANELDGPVGNEKIIYPCVEIINFHKEFGLPEKSLNVNEQMEIQSYLFAAHRLLSLNYELSKNEVSRNPEADKQKVAERRKGHKEFAMACAERFCQLSQGVEFEKDEPLYRDLLDIRLYYSNQVVNAAFAEMANQDFFNQDTISLVMLFLGSIHREGRKGAVFSMFEFPKENSGMREASGKLAFDFIKQSLLTCSNLHIKKFGLDSLKFIFERDEHNLIGAAVENRFVPFHISDLTQKRFFRDYQRMSPDDRKKVPTNQRPAVVMFNKVVDGLDLDNEKLKGQAALAKLEGFNNEYFALIETVFSKSQCVLATPKLLRECAMFLQEHKYSKESVAPLFKHADRLEALITGEVKLWKETPVVYVNGKPENKFWSSRDVQEVYRRGRKVRNKPLSPPSSPRSDVIREKKVKLPEVVPELENKTRGLKHLSQKPAEPVLFSAVSTRAEKRPAATNNNNNNDEGKRLRKRSPSPTK